MYRLIDNDNGDEHFYELLLFTGQREESATRSKVRFFGLIDDQADECCRSISYCLVVKMTQTFGDCGLMIHPPMTNAFSEETSIDFFSPHQSKSSRKTRRRRSKDVSCRSLGKLNYLYLFHDNSGDGSFASWFFTSMIVRDLQTEEVSYFIGQCWLGVEKDQGQVIDHAIHPPLASTSG